MSRMYEALKRTENPVIQMIEAEQTEAPPPDSVETMLALGEEICERQQPTPAPAVEVRLPLAEPKAPARDGYRTVALQVKSKEPLLPFDGTDPRPAECYRVLRTNLLHHSASPKVIAISSAGQGDGKSTNAINLSGILALKQDSRVLLIDADLRHGSIAPMLGIPESPGLAEVLTGRCSLRDAIVQADILPNLHILPGGQPPINPAELLDSALWRELVAQVRKQFPFVIVDTTPVAIVADYALVQQVCDGTVLVVRPDHTDRGNWTKALQTVPKGKLLGTVLNSAEDWLLWRTNDYYGYYGRKNGA